MSIKREKAIKLQHKLWKNDKIHLDDVDPDLYRHIGCPNGKKCGLCRYGTYYNNPTHTDRRKSKIRIQNEI